MTRVALALRMVREQPNASSSVVTAATFSGVTAGAVAESRMEPAESTT